MNTASSRIQTLRPRSMRLARPLVLTVLALALAACASSRGLAPQGAVLESGALHAERTLAQANLSTAAWPASDWWRALGDPQLNALIAEGLQHSPSLAAADARLRQAQARTGKTQADRGPSLSLSGGYTGLQLPESMVGEELGGSYGGSMQVVLDFRYGVDLWGGKRTAWEAAVDQAHAAEVDAQAARLNLSAAIAEGYAQLAYAWSLHDVANDEATRAQQTLELTRQRRGAGIDSELQVRQAQARVPAAQQQVQSAQQQIDEARTLLAALVGQSPDRGLDIARPVLAAAIATQLPSNLPADLLGRRPDVVAARWRVEAADKDVAVAKTRFYPSLNLAALGGVINPDVGKLLESGSVLGLVAPALSLPIFDGGKLRANLAGSDAQYDLAVADYNQKVLDALREVADQVNAVRSLQQRARAQNDAVQTVSAAVDIAQQRYRAGIGSYLDVLSVQEQLLLARQRMASLQSQQLVAAVRLQRALGGGFTPEPARDTAHTVPVSVQPNF
ncbi:AdeC/AdeK/OprM family multidrug efflux complex outer membrane factor [Xanthomonas fragariae]|uniref:AdeC/AdeK/OprM family multidrug efflux complex outer membrane factor n=1 Tax=Xanthomonas fragariae TaxID=48664 RepID=UPI001ABEC803|nr:AdeC/AdeK/OprM family multidrug efflux complex outer membrane factor [Xanthomonas fragariae]UKR51456.1 AdeC/AdeK/OprM family multidrug efflux complex outer membrane factor [Xanthomonas fragariae]